MQCRLRSLRRGPAGRGQNTSLYYLRVCVSHCVLAVQRVGCFLGCASSLSPRLSLPQLPALPLRWALGAPGRWEPGFPCIWEHPRQRLSLRNPATRGRGVSAACRPVLSHELVGRGWGLHFPQFRSGPAHPSPRPRWSAQRGQQVQCVCELPAAGFPPVPPSWLRELPNPMPAPQPCRELSVLGTGYGT